MRTMISEPELVCEKCGAPLSVTGKAEEAPDPVRPLLCVLCAAHDQEAGPRRARGANRAAILLCVGLFVLVISAAADWLAFGSSEGFGWKQLLGLGMAGILLLIGALVRIPTLSVIGLFIGLLSVLADWLGFGNAEGFGWQQMAGCALGAALMALGLVFARAVGSDRTAEEHR